MPLYMDYHQFPSITIEEVKQAHMADKKTQDKYGVVYHQFWVNEKEGTIFCLIEGPNPEACVQVHREAHGDVACNIIEVEPGILDLILGNSNNINHGLVYQNSGEVDTGFRYIMIVDAVVKTNQKHIQDISLFEFTNFPKRKALSIVENFGGREIKNDFDDVLIFVFSDDLMALHCAINIQNTICNQEQDYSDFEVRIGINEGQPVTHKEGFFEEAIDYAKHLSLLAGPNGIVLSKSFQKLINGNSEFKENSNVKVINQRQELFVQQFLKYAEENIAKQDLNIQNISQTIGVSKPQLYRKITGLTGRSPNTFIRDIKMKKAMGLLRNNDLNVSQVALEVGYSNPSYFTKCFQEKYGISPSKVI